MKLSGAETTPPEPPANPGYPRLNGASARRSAFLWYLITYVLSSPCREGQCNPRCIVFYPEPFRTRGGHRGADVNILPTRGCDGPVHGFRWDSHDKRSRPDQRNFTIVCCDELFWTTRGWPLWARARGGWWFSSFSHTWSQGLARR